jgi:hypothetical protein
MRSSLDLKTIAGLLALLATFVLALPGVKAVRAEDWNEPIVSGDGPQCNPVTLEDEMAHSGAAMQQLQAKLAAQAAAEAGKGPNAPILLNNRGYNYGPGRDLDQIAAEAVLLRSER